jgi:hypothetical protein
MVGLPSRAASVRRACRGGERRGRPQCRCADGIGTPSLSAQGEQRRSTYFNIERDNSTMSAGRLVTPPDSRCVAAAQPASDDCSSLLFNFESSTSKGLTSRTPSESIGGKNASDRGYIGTFTTMRDCYRVALPSAPTLENVSSALKSQSPSNHVAISRHRPSRLARPAPVGFGHDMAMDWPRV